MSDLAQRDAPAAPAASAQGEDKPTRSLSRSQKAAAVLLSVGADAAAEVMRHLSESEVEQISLEVATLGALGSDQLTDVLGEFKAEALGRAQLLSGGEMPARDLLRRLRGSDADEILDRLLASVQTMPFHFLRMHEPAEVIQHLRDEHPQTIALILAHLPTRFSSQLLAGFDPELQPEIAQRVAQLDRTSPEVVERVEAALEARIGALGQRSDSGRGGVKELAAILNLSDRSTERAILGELEASDPELADAVRALMFVFEDLVMIEDRGLQELLRQIDTPQLALALKGVSDVVRETIMRNLSERARELLEEEIEVLGAVRLREVEEAQTQIVAVIRQMDEQGELVINRPGESDLVE